MHPTRIVHPVPRRLVVVLLLLTGACTSWHVETMPPAELVAERKPEQVRIRLVDRQRFVLRMPTIRGDSLVGGQDGGARSVAFAEIDEIAVRRVDALKTTGAVVLVAGVAFGTLFVAYIIACATSGGCGS
jgi:hypothetical protein